MFRTIVFATDFTDSAARAQHIAIELARESDARIHVVHVFDAPAYAYSDGVSYVDVIAPLREAAETMMKRFMKDVLTKVPSAEAHLVEGRAWEQVLKVAAETKADLIVVGTHGRQGAAHLFLGSVAGKVARMSPIPVLTVRGDS